MKFCFRKGVWRLPAGIFALLILVAAASARSDSDGDSLTLVGLDAKGSPVEVLMKKKTYRETLSTIGEAVNDSAVVAMSKQENRPGWALRSLAIGIGVGLEAGLGPILKVKITPRFRMLFANMPDIIIP